jgi:hypothetical protein
MRQAVFNQGEFNGKIVTIHEIAYDTAYITPMYGANDGKYAYWHPDFFDILVVKDYYNMF